MRCYRLSSFGVALVAFVCCVQMGMAEVTNLTATAETSIQEAFPTSNFGGGGSFTSGGRLQGGRSRGLLRFDMAGKIPAGATINSVSLTLKVTNSNGPDSTFDLHRLTASWVEGTGSDMGGGGTDGATWNERSPATEWTAVGGDYVASESASAGVGGAGTSSTFTSADLAEDVQFWLDNPGANFGWLVRSEDEATPATIRRFGGHLSATDFPVLVINYTAGTVTPAQPVLTNLAIGENKMRFSFNGEAGRSYTVEFRDSLSSGSWNVLTNISTLPSSMTLHITNTISSGERYFRAKTP